MKISETFGFVETPRPHPKPGTRSREGRPNSTKFKKRPKKNLWFKDDKLWTTDLDLEHGGGYTLVTDENEERVFASDKGKTRMFGYWDKKKKRGITYKEPMPYQAVAHPTTTFKDFVKQS